jgi:formylglycine-generating enzyme required for sulfatase activity
MTNCGAASESCCKSLEVTGGTYYRTYVNSGSGPTGEADPATVSGFQLDKYLVTVGRFRQFVDAWNNGAGYAPPAGSGKHTQLNGGLGLANSASAGTYETGWVAANDGDVAPTNANLTGCGPISTWTNAASSQENLPINCVNWYEAYAFCIWDGGFLPSEAEWRYAAAGGSQQLAYEWGSTVPGTACPGTGCEYAIYDCYDPSGSGTCSTTSPLNIAPVGTAMLGAGLWGQLDLDGELTQWTLDLWAHYVDPCTDCAYVPGGTAGGAVYGGASFHDTLAGLLTWTRDGSFPPAWGLDDMGFRCARAP